MPTRTRTAFIFGPTSATHDMADMNDFYDHQPRVRQKLQLVADWSGVPVEVLLHRAARPADQPLMRVNSLALSAGMLGIRDVLVDAGIRPSLVAGISLGERVAACAAGALTDRQLIDALVANDERPASPAPELREAIGFVFVPAGHDHRHYGRQQHHGVHVAVDFGTVRARRGRLLMLSGYREALQRLAETDGNPVTIPDEEHGCAAHHTPLRAHARAQLARHLAGTRIAAPAVPVVSCLGDGFTARTADEVRELFLRNQVETLHVQAMIDAVAAHRPTEVVALGPFMRKGGFDFPFPVQYADSPAALAEIVGRTRAATN